MYWIISLYSIFILPLCRFFSFSEDCSIPISEGKLLVTRTGQHRDLGKQRTVGLLYILVD